MKTVAFFLTLAATAWPAAMTFDFEAETATYSAGSGAPGSLTSLSITQNGLTITITRIGGVEFDVINTAPNANFPNSWGDRSLSPFSNSLSGNFLVNFSAPVDSFSIEFGDFGVDSDNAFVELFDAADGGGNQIGDDTEAYGTQSLPTFGTLSAPANGIRSAILGGGSTGFPASLFYDNLTVDYTPAANPIPEPGTWALCAAGIAAVGLARRRR